MYMGGDMVEVRDIRKSYGRKLVLGGVGFSAQPGEQIALVGRNGCGKSTLMQIMAGLIKADSGTVSYFGQAIKTGSSFSHTVGYLPQENPLIEELSVADNISLWSGKRVSPDDEVVKMFHLKELLKEPVYKLSGGMKRRVAIACACVHMPPVMLMDEPTAALDIYYRLEVRKWMKQYRDMNGTIITVTHDSDEMSDSTRCLLIEDGIIKEYEEEKKNAF
jgi:ABC-2 type transport system ATP-binding protein